MHRKAGILLANSIKDFTRLDEWLMEKDKIRLPLILGGENHNSDSVLVLERSLELNRYTKYRQFLFTHGNINALILIDNKPYYAIDEYTHITPLDSIGEGLHAIKIIIYPQGIVGERYNPATLESVYIVSIDPILYIASLIINALTQFYKLSDINDKAWTEKLLKHIDRSIKVSPPRPDVIELSVKMFGSNIYSKYTMLIDELLRMSKEKRRLLSSNGYTSTVYPEDLKLLIDYIINRLDERVKLQGKTGVFYSVMHSHIDAAWLWRIEDTAWKLAKTLAKTITLQKIYPETISVLSTTYFFELLEKDYPLLYNEVIGLVKTGKVIPVGGMWVESDVYIIPQESLIRQFLYGQRILRVKTGRYAWIGWLPDSFGFSGNLPQIMLNAGIKLFITHKPIWNDTNKFPYDTFYWKGINSEEIPTHIITGELAKTGTIKSILDYWNEYREKEIVPSRIYTYGHCDGGSGPTHDMVERLRINNNLPNTPQIIHGRLEDFYKEITQHKNELPKYEGEIYVEYHRGAYTTNHCIKQRVWMLDYLLRVAEQVYTWLHVENKSKYPEETLDKLWKQLLLAEFHDILSGTITNELSSQICRILEETINKTRKTIHKALMKLVPSIGKGIIIYNPTLYSRKEIIYLRDDEDTKSIIVEVPPLGYMYIPKHYISHFKQTSEKITVRESGEGYVVKNKYLTVRISKKGWIASIIDNEAGYEYLAKKSNILKVSEDLPGEWDAWNIDKESIENGEELEAINSAVTYSDGKSVEIRFKYRYMDSIIEQTISMNALSRRIGFKTRIIWRNKWRLLKTWFYPKTRINEYICDTHFGYVKRKVSDWMYEAPMLSWCTIENSEGYGLAVISPTRHGVSVSREGIGLSLLRSPVLPDPLSGNGEVVIEYSIYPYRNGFKKAGIPRIADQVVNPLYVFKINNGIENKGLETSSPLRVNDGFILLSAFKKEYHGDNIVLRLYNPLEREARVKVSFNFNIREVRVSNILEDTSIGRLPIENNAVEIRICGFCVKTIILRIAGPGE